MYLIEEGPNLSYNKERSISKNFAWADVWLRSTDAKEVIQKIANDETEDLNPKEVKNYLLALHIIRKIAQGKKYNEKKKERALQLLKQNEIDLAAIDDKTRRLFQKARSVFNDAYNEAHKKEQQAKPETNQQQKEQPKPQEKPEPVKQQQQQTKPTNPLKQPETNQPAPQQKEKTPKEIQAEIKKLRDDTVKVIENFINKTKESDSLMAKHKIAKNEMLMKTFLNKMNKYIEQAGYGPRNAQSALLKAEGLAKLTAIKAERNTLKSAVRIGTESAVKSIRNVVPKIKELSNKTSSKIQSSEQAKKALDVYKKVKEKIKSTSEKGMEALIDKLSKKR